LRERTVERINARNGYQERLFDTRVGTIATRIPKPRHGWYLPLMP
jgi:transposase-like protein